MYTLLVLGLQANAKTFVGVDVQLDLENSDI